MQSRKFQIRLAIALGIGLLSGLSPTFAGLNVLQSMEQQFQTIVKTVKPAVVEVIATREVRQSRLKRERKNLSLMTQTAPVYHYQNIGSGIVIDSTGHIVTTGVIVAGANKIEVAFAGGQRQPAKLVGHDRFTDIAVLSVERGYPHETTIGDSDEIRAGSWVVTIGCSYGKCSTMSFGVVNGLEILPHRPFYEAIQINASVSPGNSGGAVANTSGEIIGIITATLAQAQSSPYDKPFVEPVNPSKIWSGQDISFAIPIKTVQSIARQIIRHGEVSRGWLGVSVNLEADGVGVTTVVAHSPAAAAGILRRDIIVGFNGTPVHTFAELRKLVTSSAPNTPVTIKVLRGTRYIESEVVLGTRR